MAGGVGEPKETGEKEARRRQRHLPTGLGREVPAAFEQMGVVFILRALGGKEGKTEKPEKGQRKARVP